MVQAPMPELPIPRGMAGPGFLAHIAIAKFCDHLPLYRQAMLGRVIHADDTPVPVQDPTREHCRTGRLWAYVSTGGIVYDATEDRCRDGPAQFLAGFAGYLQCDAYAGYDALFARSEGTIVEVACWAHARRKFVEAEKTSPQLAHEAVARIQALYAIEREATDLEPPARAALRQQKAKPLLDALKVWLDGAQTTALPKTPIGEALTYAANQWAALNVYVTDGDPTAYDFNQPGDPFTRVNNWFAQGSTPSAANKLDAKIDHNFSEKQRISSRYGANWGWNGVARSPETFSHEPPGPTAASSDRFGRGIGTDSCGLVDQRH
jgi:hypothetical protein